MLQQAMSPERSKISTQRTPTSDSRMDYSSFDCITRSSASLKYDGSNWEFWKYCMELLLKKRKLLTLAVGDRKRPSPDIPNNTASTSVSPSSLLDLWDKDNVTTLAIIAKSVDDQVNIRMSTLFTSGNEWQVLWGALRRFGTFVLLETPLYDNVATQHTTRI
jgi:hypothetical protein